MTAYGKLAGVLWYNGKYGYLEPDCPTLVVAYETGRIYIMKHENDDGRLLTYPSHFVS